VTLSTPVSHTALTVGQFHSAFLPLYCRKKVIGDFFSKVLQIQQLYSAYNLHGATEWCTVLGL